MDLLIGAAEALDRTITARAHEFRDTPMVGRTHGIHAEPTTFGVKLALWALQVRRDIERLRRARAGIAVGKLSGAVGTYSNVDPHVEAHVCAALGLTPVPATQVLARDRHAELLYACASVGATVEQAALEIRHLQRTEVREVEEPFRAGKQKGSSAMPHKRNPVKCEQLCGLSRVLRADLMAGLENVALWHERDISHSSVERVILPDACLLAYYMLVKMRAVVEDMHVYPERMLENLDSSYGLVFSQPVLLALVEAGSSRDDAYRMVQRNAMRTWDERRPFIDVFREDADVVAALEPAALEACFDLNAAVANVGRTFEVLDAAVSPGRGITLPHLYSGKVRDLYDAGDDRLLMVASDRVSVFDVVLADPIPDKGRVLTAISSFWFDLTVDILPNHVISVDPAEFPDRARPAADGRAMLVRRTDPVRMECIARGFLFGGAWAEYREHGTVQGRADAAPACRRRSASRSRCSRRRPRRSPDTISR